MEQLINRILDISSPTEVEFHGRQTQKGGKGIKRDDGRNKDKSREKGGSNHQNRMPSVRRH